MSVNHSAPSGPVVIAPGLLAGPDALLGDRPVGGDAADDALGAVAARAGAVVAGLLAAVVAARAGDRGEPDRAVGAGREVGGAPGRGRREGARRAGDRVQADDPAARRLLGPPERAVGAAHDALRRGGLARGGPLGDRPVERDAARRGRCAAR